MAEKPIFGEPDTGVASSVEGTLSPDEGGTVIEVVYRYLRIDLVLLGRVR